MAHASRLGASVSPEDDWICFCDLCNLWATPAIVVRHDRVQYQRKKGLSNKTGKFSFCPAENFSLSDKRSEIHCKIIVIDIV